MHIPGIKYVYMQSFMFFGISVRYWSSTGKEKAEEEHGNSVKIEITSITPVLHAFLDFFFRYH